MEASINHVAVIMDGNGRWARSKGLPRVMGHRQGVKTVKNIIKWSLNAGLKQLTLFAFGQENWHRPSMEIQGLMALLEQGLQQELPFLQENHIRLQVIGDLSPVKGTLVQKIREVELATKDNEKLLVTIAFSYSGQWHISDVVHHLLQEKKSFDTTEQVQAYLDQALRVGQHHPEILIRTSGEKRISNFMLWQLAYTELFFLDAFWPDLTEAMFTDVLKAFDKRQRRFGRVAEEVSHEV